MGESEDKSRQKTRVTDLFFNLVPDLLYIASAEDGYFKELNPAWEKTLGFTIEELLSKPFIEFIHPDDRASSMSAVEKYLKGQSTAYLENRYVCKDGSYKWLAWTATPAEENLLYGIARDITESKNAEKSLQESEERYREVVEGTGDLITRVDGQGKFIYVNHIAEKIFGIDTDKCVGMSAFQFIHPEDKQNTEEWFSECVQINLPQATIENRQVNQKTGEVYHMLWTCNFYYDKEGQVKRVNSIARDITEKKKTEDELKFRSGITEQVNAAVITTGLDFKINWANHAFSNLYGYSLDEIVDQTPDFLNIDPLSEEIQKDIYQTMSSGNAWTGDVMNKRKDGTAFLCEMNICPLKDENGNVFAYACHQRDITKRKLAEENFIKAKAEIEEWNKVLVDRVQEKTGELLRSHAQLIQSEKLSAMGQMAGGLAHELNSPLAGLLPMLEQYRNEARQGSRAYRELSLMIKSCEYMVKIVKDFGTFSRKSKGEFYNLNINEVIEDTLSFSAGKLKEKGIQLIKEYEDNLPKVNGEKTELQQVILNMIKNAIDAMPEKGKFIIKTSFAKDKNNVIMEFIDNGVGIEQEQLNKVFDPFYTTKRLGEGTGLGLSISYGIINKHEGKILVESEPGKGTKFAIYIPAVIVQ